jgi:hypothetical protein
VIVTRGDGYSAAERRSSPADSFKKPISASTRKTSSSPPAARSFEFGDADAAEAFVALTGAQRF